MSKLVLGYWNIRGLGEPIRYLLDYAQVDFEDKRYNFGPAPEFDTSEWLKEKFKLGLDFPNLPYIMDGDVKLTQSLAILRYLARKLKLAPESGEEQTRCDLAEQQCMELQDALAGVAYDADFEKLRPDYLAQLPQQLELVSKFLADRDYLLGDRITYVDFIFYETLDFHRLLEPTCWDKFENLVQFLQRIERLPAIAKHMTSEKFNRRAIFSAFANFGGQRQ